MNNCSTWCMLIAIYIAGTGVALEGYGHPGPGQNGALYSQYGIDELVFRRFFINTPTGVFVDIGAHDGVTYSNSYFFEKHHGWQGLCVEPIPYIFKKLRESRSCVCVEGCISNQPGEATFSLVERSADPSGDMLSGLTDKYDQRHIQRLAHSHTTFKYITVRCYLLNDLLDQYEFNHINFMSIDTEGGELDILKSIDFDRFTIDVICVENNYQDAAIGDYMHKRGYRKVPQQLSAIDEIYLRNGFYDTAM